MTRNRLAALALTLAAPLAIAHAAEPKPFTLHSVSIDLPNGSHMFPGGKEADVVNANCLTCHSVEMVLTQPTLSKATWDAEVHKMVTVYKAPVSEADIPAIVAYLAALH